MVLRNVDLTGSDRAFMSVELFQDLGFGALGSADTNGFVVGDVWDDLAMIEVGSEETGWSVINCPFTAGAVGNSFTCPHEVSWVQIVSRIICLRFIWIGT